jgi:hypothetical protein
MRLITDYLKLSDLIGAEFYDNENIYKFDSLFIFILYQASSAMLDSNGRRLLELHIRKIIKESIICTRLKGENIRIDK